MSLAATRLRTETLLAFPVSWSGCLCLAIFLGELPFLLQNRCVPSRRQVLSAAPQAPFQPDYSGAEPLPEPDFGGHGGGRRPFPASQRPRTGRCEFFICVGVFQSETCYGSPSAHFAKWSGRGVASAAELVPNMGAC